MVAYISHKKDAGYGIVTSSVEAAMMLQRLLLLKLLLILSQYSWIHYAAAQNSSGIVAASLKFWEFADLNACRCLFDV